MSGFFKRQLKFKNVFSPFKKKEQLVDSVPHVELNANEEIKPSVLRRLGLYLKQVATDYVDVGKDTLKNIRKHPVKAACYGTVMGSFLVLYKKNPDYLNYIEARKQQTNEIIQCVSTYNRKTEYYLNSLTKMDNSKMLEYKSLVFFSLILERKCSVQDALYENQCLQLTDPSKYNIFNVADRLLRFISRIVDVGCLDNWYFLNQNFRDYDVDEREWQNKK